MTVKDAGGRTTVKEFNDLQSALAYQRSFHPKLTLQALGEELKDMPSGADIVKAMAISAIDPSSVVGVTIEALAEQAGLSESDASIIGNRTKTIVASASFGFGLAKLAKAVEKRLAKSGIKRAAKRSAERAAAARAGNATRNTRFIDGVRIVDRRTGKVLEGTVDLKPTLDRIAEGRSFPYRNDGSIFQNRPLPGKTTPELPVKPQGYYTEYVHPTSGISGPGPQRIVMGQGGEIYYTPDHYTTFIPVNP